MKRILGARANIGKINHLSKIQSCFSGEFVILFLSEAPATERGRKTLFGGD